MKMSKPYFIFCLVLVELLRRQPQLSFVQGQQIYVDNKQLHCDKHPNFTRGFACNGFQSSCQAYLTFRSNPPYDSPAAIGLLLGTQPDLIAQANNVSSFGTIPTDKQILVPIKNCSCSGPYYQYNTSYRLNSTSETYFILANDTYQGLTTCQAMTAQNPYDVRNLMVGQNLEVPLRCACPTSNQVATGVKYLLTFMVTWKDDISSIAELFGLEEQSVLDANELSPDDIIYPFTPILVPLKSKPTSIQRIASPPPAPPPPQSPPAVPAGSGKSKKRWVFVGVAIGAVSLLVLSASSLWFFCGRRRYFHQKAATDPVLPTQAEHFKNPSHSPPKNFISTEGVRYAVESLTMYMFEDLQTATGFFGEANKIKGSVYLGSFRGDEAVVKIMNGDVSGEIDLLKRINHNNIIRLSGFCVHGGNTYLVYEHADNGSISDWLHSNKHQACPPLTWKQRLQVAYDVADALTYLHNYANPPHIHKNLKTSNILLDSNFRAKLSNFGLARKMENGDGGFLQLTRHVVGTQGYMAPEYIENGMVTPKLDVFAFGVVMLELLSGRKAAAEKDGRDREDSLFASIRVVLEGDNVREKLRGFVDPSLGHEYPMDLAYSMAQLAKSCVAHDLNSRPAMPEVFMVLSKILSSSLDWDPSDEVERSESISHTRGR
ncbi:hypothetical protein I3843_08G078300 [Carya illinoinensis]|nr:hypothetical protein I3843_08G078300 [Carya illinoinensis]